MHVQGVAVLLRSWCFGEKGGGEISKEEKKKGKKNPAQMPSPGHLNESGS